MSEECTHDCSTCSSSCESRQMTKEDFLEKPHALSNIKKVIAVVSGKGGVGKSLITSLLASATRRSGKTTAILDADITGPSIPRIFGTNEKAAGSEAGIYPAVTETGIRIMSVNMLLENDTDPVIWRGPVIAGVVKQFWTDVIWSDVDIMFIDMPPGTGDVPLTVFQSIPVDGVIVVATPQELVSMIVEKAVNMANTMEIPVIGLVENMSSMICPDCGKETFIFGKSRARENAQKHNIPHIASIPLDPALAAACDAGKIEYYECDRLNELLTDILDMPEREQR